MVTRRASPENGPVDRSKDDAADRSTTDPDVGADFLQLRSAEAPLGGLAGWLTARLRSAIAEGRLPVGSRLPPSRQLAAELRVSRGVVTEAYRRLAEDGHVAGRGRGGTVVLAAPEAAAGGGGEQHADRARPFTAFPPGPEVFDTLRAAPSRVDLSPACPT